MLVLHDTIPSRYSHLRLRHLATENKKITPIHVAAINPNAAYLKELCLHEPDYNQPDTDNWYFKLPC